MQAIKKLNDVISINENIKSQRREGVHILETAISQQKINRLLMKLRPGTIFILAPIIKHFQEEENLEEFLMILS